MGEKAEIWKDVEGYEGKYQVSNKGKVKSLERVVIRGDGKPFSVRERYLRGSKDTKGYYQVELREAGNRDIRFIHRLVADAFIEKQDGKTQINHIDGDKTNNSSDNLEWVTCEENIRHAWNHGLARTNCGEEHGNSKLTIEAVKYIREHYKPRDREFGQRALARKFGVTQHPIMMVIKERTWKNV